MTFMVVEPAVSEKVAALANWREKRKRVSVYFITLSHSAALHLISHNYAIPQTHAVFYPHRNDFC